MFHAWLMCRAVQDDVKVVDPLINISRWNGSVFGNTGQEYEGKDEYMVLMDGKRIQGRFVSLHDG